MKKPAFLFVAFILTACASAPQVTVVPEPTPTLTPIPTPTLDPRFIALQESISDSGERFSLLADGLIYDGETPVPGLTFDPDGTVTLEVNGETVTLDPADVDFDDEEGISIKGYEFDQEAGAWAEANETLAGGLMVETGEPDKNGNAVIEKFIAPDDLEAEDLERWEAQWDETRLGLEGDWVKTPDGRVVLLDDLSDPDSVLAEYKIFEQIDTMQVVVDGDKLVADGENVILSQADVEEWKNELPVHYDEVQAENLAMVEKAVSPVYKSLNMEVGAEVLPGYILSTDGETGVSIRYVVIHTPETSDSDSARQSNEGIVFFRNNKGGYTYFFVENFELQFID